MPLLEVRELKRSFGGIEAVADVSFDVEAGSIHGLIGPNGSGKTTIFNVLSGYYAPTAGKILFDGRSIGSLPPHRIVRVGIARTFQNLRLFHSLTVRENVQVAAMHAGTPWWRHALGFPVGWLRSRIRRRQDSRPTARTPWRDPVRRPADQEPAVWVAAPSGARARVGLPAQAAVA